MRVPDVSDSERGRVKRGTLRLYPLFADMKQEFIGLGPSEIVFVVEAIARRIWPILYEPDQVLAVY